MDNKPFGYSLHLDMYGVPAELCDDLTHCYNYLEQLVKHLGMSTQAPPNIFRSPETYPEKAGLSGFVPLIESGISIHTLTRKNFVTIDIYTCGCLDKEKTIAFSKEWFKFIEFESHYLLRGLKYHGG